MYVLRNSKEVTVSGVKQRPVRAISYACLGRALYHLQWGVIHTADLCLTHMSFWAPRLICTAREGCVLRRPTRARTATDTLGRAHSPARPPTRCCAAVLRAVPRAARSLPCCSFRPDSQFLISEPDTVTLPVVAGWAAGVAPGFTGTWSSGYCSEATQAL